MLLEAKTALRQMILAEASDESRFPPALSGLFGKQKIPGCEARDARVTTSNKCIPKDAPPK